MTRHQRPTPVPLTDTERTRLDHLVRRAAGRLGPDEAGVLLRLWEHDRSDRTQERRTAGGARAAARRTADRTKTATTVLRIVADHTQASPAEQLTNDQIAVGTGEGAAMARLRAALTDAGIDLATELDRIGPALRHET
ncbi:hypothetical protein ACFWP2_20570 [Kitasatospora sp. NPDC058444]|uniref:hypothetical protein n=1 Tax=Kitasatospora sp. NPDC058444 TaxID=3346504 RepID=UPI003649734C